MKAIQEAVGQLELFPMTSDLLQATRVGRLLNDIRKQTDDKLHSRIRRLISAWRRLLDPGQQSVVPADLVVPRSAGPAELRKSQTVARMDHLSDSVPVSPALSGHSYRSSPGQSRQHRSNRQPGCAAIEETAANGRHDAHQLNSKRIKLAVDPSSSSTSKNGTYTATTTAPAAARNGWRGNGGGGESLDEVASQCSNSSAHTGGGTGPARSSSRAVAPPGPGGLPSKAKSMADFMAQFGASVNRETANRILTNEIAKEPDVRPSVLPESVRPRQYRTKFAATISNPGGAGESTASSSVTVAKSEMMDRFLESAVQYCSDDDNDTTRPSTPTKVASTEQLSLEEVTPLTTTITGSSKKTKKKKRNREKRAADALKRLPLPVTNYMNVWPSLPPLPPKNPALDSTNITASSSSATSSSVSNPTLEDVNHLLDSDWPGVNCTLDPSTNQIIHLRDMCSVPCGKSMVHVLPWVDFDRKEPPAFPETPLRTSASALPQIW